MILDDPGVANLSSAIEGCLRTIKAQAITQETVHSSQSERVTDLQQSIKQNHSEMLGLMGTFKIAAVDDGISEIVSIVRGFEGELQHPVTSLDAIKSGFEKQKFALELIQTILNELVAKHKTTCLDEPGKKSDKLSSAWITAGTIVASMFSAVASGYSALRPRALNPSTLNENILGHPPLPSSINVPSNRQVQQTQGLGHQHEPR
jgi:hypothetical protein